MTSPRRRRLRRVLLGVLALLIAAGLAGFLPREPVRRAVESSLRAAFGPNASVGAVHIVPGALRGSVDNLVVDTNAYRLEVPRLELGLRAGMLLGGGIRLRYLTLDRPVLRIRAAPPGVVPETTAAPTFPSIVISNLILGNGIVIVELSGTRGTIESRGVRASGAVGEAALSLDLPSIVWHRPDPFDLGRAAARLVIDPGLAARVEQLHYTKGRSAVRASGDLGSLASLTPNLRFDAPVHLADWSLLSRTPDLRGDLAVEGTLAGTLDALRVSIKGRGEGVGVADIVAQAIGFSAEHDAGRTTANLDARAFGGRLEASGFIQGTSTNGRARLVSVAFESLPKSAGLPSELRGRLSGDLTWDGASDGRVGVTSKLRSEASYGQPLTASAVITGGVFAKENRLDLRFTTTANTQGAQTLRSGLLQAEGTARGAWPPTLEGVAKIVATAALGATPEPLEAQTRFRSGAMGSSIDIKGTFLGGAFEGGGRLARSRIEDGRLTATDLDLKRIDPRMQGTARLSLTAGGPAARPALEGRIDLSTLGYQKVDLGDGVVTLAGTPSAARWTLALPALELSGSGDASTGKAGVLAGTFTAERTRLSTFAPLVPALQGFEGVASASAEVKIPFESPSNAEIAARISTLEVRIARFGPARTEPFSIRYRGGRLAVSEFRAEGPGLRAAVDGDFGLDSAHSVSGTARLDVDLSALTPPVESLTGKLDGNLQFGGVADRPLVTGAINLTAVDFARPNQPRLHVESGTIRVDNNVVVADELRAEVDGEALVLSGRAPVPSFVAGWRADPRQVAAAEAADLSLRWDGFDAGASLSRLRPTAEDRLAARLTGRLNLRGGLAGLDEIEASLASEPADFTIGEIDGRLNGFEVRMAQGRLSSEGIEVAAAGGTFRLSGGAGIENRDLDLVGHGKLDLRVLSPILVDTALSGAVDIDARVTGTASSPDARGHLKLSGGTARFRGLTQALTEIQAEVSLAGSQVRLDRASAVLGGGTLEAAGTMALRARSAEAVEVSIKGNDMAVRYPEGLRSYLDADLELTGRPGAFLLAGDLKATRAIYDRDFQTSSFLASAPVEDSPTLRSIALNLRLTTLSPLRVRNDTARLEATGQLQIRGDMQSPIPSGRFDVIVPGGELTLLGARYPITRGTIAYNGAWDPEIDLEVQRRLRLRQSAPSDVDTVAGDYTATVTANGTMTEITRELLQLALGGRSDERSDTLRFSAEGPGDLEPSEVASLLLFGRRDLNARVAGEQTGALLASRLARQIQKGLPFENITIQPELVSRETATPDARFTFGAPLADGVDLTYSQSLSTPEDRLIQVEARTVRNLAVNVKREHNFDAREDLITLGAGQRLEWGGVRPPRIRRRQEEAVKLTEVRIDGLAGSTLEKVARDVVKSKVGKKATIWTAQDDGDRVREAFLRRGYLDVEVGAQLEGTLAILSVRPGRQYVARIEGMADPPDLSEALRRSLYEEEALEGGQAKIFETLFKRGHLRARVEAAGRDEGEIRVLAFKVDPGLVLKVGSITFPGASALTKDALLSAAGGPGALLSTPEDARTAMRAAYEAIHYPRAEVAAPRVEEADGRVSIEVPINEGRQALITKVVFEGAARPEAELLSLSELRTGMPYDEVPALGSVDAIRNDYYHRGYASARVFALHEDTPEGIVLTYQVNEGQRLTVGSIEIAGLNRVRESFVRSNIAIETGDPVNPARLSETERRLLALTVFSRVNSRFTDEDPSVITIEVQERPRYAAGYDVRYNDLEKTTALVDGEIRNIFGRGVGAGLRYRRSRTLDEWRGTLFVPSSLWNSDLTVSTFREKETDFGEGDSNVTQLVRGFQVQQSIAVSPRTSVLYGYRFSRARITSPFLPFPSTQGVAGLNLSAFRDTRDDVLNARTGSFLALNLTLAPAAFGSDLNFAKGLLQAFISVPVGERMTWAQGYRLGMAHVFADEPLIPSEGFRAGGANTIRGFASDSLRGRGFGAQGLVVVNQELRFRSDSPFGGAVFYDAGQVFETVKDFGFDLRHAVGAGLRYASPFGLLRLDVGLPLRRREGEKAFHWFFSLGQAF